MVDECAPDFDQTGTVWMYYFEDDVCDADIEYKECNSLVPSSSPSGGDSGTSGGAIAAAVIGSIAGVLLIFFGARYYMRPKTDTANEVAAATITADAFGGTQPEEDDPSSPESTGSGLIL